MESKDKNESILASDASLDQQLMIPLLKFAISTEKN
jgi:hypothetical protein